MRKSILLASALMLLIACGGKKTSSDDAAVADSANVQATAVADSVATVADSVATVADEATDDEDAIDELLFTPDLKSDKPLDLSDGKDKAAKYFPVWDEDIVYEEDEEEGVVRYQLSLGYDRPLQQLYQVLPGKPADKKEVGRTILIDLNKDGHTDALVCLGRYGVNKDLYFDAYLWDKDYDVFNRVENFREIPNPGIDKKTSNITSHIGSDLEVWLWKGKNKNKIEKKLETREEN
jgi:hypothetical protein